MRKDGRKTTYFSIRKFKRKQINISVDQTAQKPSEATSPSEPRIIVLSGEYGSSPQWGSGWLNLSTPMNFTAGDTLRLKIGGTAKKVLVRLLPEGKFPDSSEGIIGNAISVPENRTIKIALKDNRYNIIQISVHGGPNPWGKFPLGGDNGPATLESVSLIK